MGKGSPPAAPWPSRENLKPGLIGSGGAEKSILNRPGPERRHSARITTHLQHLQVSVDIQPVLAKQIAETLIGGRAKARDPSEFSGELRDTFDIRIGNEVGSQPRQRTAENHEFDASKPSLDGNRPTARYLNAAADQRGDIHGAAVDVKQLAFEAVLGEEALLLRHPEKRLGRVHRRVRDAQLIGGEIFGGETKKEAG